jgi:hypothetical protein
MAEREIEWERETMNPLCGCADEESPDCGGGCYVAARRQTETGHGG